MSRFPFWAQRLFNTPVALDRFKNEVLVEFAHQRLSGRAPTDVNATTLEVARLDALASDARRHIAGVRKPYAMDGNIAVVPVTGTLVQRSGYLDAESGLVGYDSIIGLARAACNDPDVGGIWMPYDTSGGEFAGMLAAAEELAALSADGGGKPIYAFIDERCCSAGYVLACSADRVFGRRECIGASISALINLVDTSKAYEKAGIEAIAIRPEWADRKARGGPGEKIDPETIAKLTSIVDEASMMFVEWVSAMRGISEKSIMDLRGDVYTGNDLLKFKLIDGVVSEGEAWAALVKAIPAS